ncbi:MAG: tetratricopeptide repeat protein [Candidatus Wallbacteria bacterium]|nr:tetratricopeptide repeat protein [Candidatus Wallbacteria bacterium]
MALTELVRLKLDTSRRFRKAGNFRAAESELNEALAVYPEHVVLLEALGQLYLAAGRVSEAERLAEELYQRHPGSAGPIKLRGEVLLRQGRPKEALEMFLEADRQTPSAYVRSLVLKALVRAREYAEAVRVGESSLGLYPDNPYVLGSLELAYAESGQPERAAEVCEKLLALRPQDPYAVRELIKNRLASLPADEALAELKSVLRVPTYQRNPQIQQLAAETFFKSGDYLEAAAAYRAAMELAPGDRHCLQQLGFSLYRAGRYEEAIGVLEPFFQDDPLNVYVRGALVKCYQMAGQPAELASAFDRAIAAHPSARQLYGIRKKALKALGGE